MIKATAIVNIIATDDKKMSSRLVRLESANLNGSRN
jgi:hypothetical protein